MEVALEAVADGFVQQDAGPAGAEDHVHLARRAVDGVEVDQGLAQGLVDLALPAVGGEPGLEAGAAAGAGRGALALAVALDRDRDVDADQGPYVAEQSPVGAQDLDRATLADDGGRDLNHARVAGAGPGVDFRQQFDLVREAGRGEGIDLVIELLIGGARGLGGVAGIAALGQRGAVGGAADGGGGNLVGVGVAGGLARHDAQAEALDGVVRRALQTPVVKDQGFALGLLQKQLAVVGAGQGRLQDGQGLVRGHARGVEDGGRGGGCGHAG
ncbi:hypothetical protein D3C85_1044540 [compost metagenome]